LIATLKSPRLCASAVKSSWLRPVDIASVVAFRVAFGLLMAVAVARYFAHGWITDFFVTPRVFFPYPGLEWIVPLPGGWMYVLFAALGGLALCVAAGFHYRVSIALFAVGFTYAHLIDRTNYLNHYYLVSLLSALMVFLPLHRAGSLDVLRRPALRTTTVPAWMIGLLRFQLGVVYAFGAVAKLNPDWLLRAQPLRIWLGANADLSVLGPWLEYPWVAYACSYAGLLFDAAIVPLLVWRRSRAVTYAAVVVFHLLTALLFPIGLFPWLMIALTPIFFPPDWPRALARAFVAPVAPVSEPGGPAERAPAREGALTLREGLGAAVLAAYALVQLALPLRHLLYPGDLQWGEAGFRFAWQIMAMEKYGHASFRVRDAATGETWLINPAEQLTALQARMMATQPDMVRSFAEYIAADLRGRGHARVEVRGDVFASLNGRPHQRLIDPDVDLAHLAAGASPETWIVPLEEPNFAIVEPPVSAGPGRRTHRGVAGAPGHTDRHREEESG